jgi:hypothetical protein
MGYYKEEIDQLFKKIYNSHQFYRQESFNDFLKRTLVNIGEDYESISAVLDRGIKRGFKLEDILGLMEQELTKKT